MEPPSFFLLSPAEDDDEPEEEDDDDDDDDGDDDEEVVEVEDEGATFCDDTLEAAALGNAAPLLALNAASIFSISAVMDKKRASIGPASPLNFARSCSSLFHLLICAPNELMFSARGPRFWYRNSPHSNKLE